VVGSAKGYGGTHSCQSIVQFLIRAGRDRSKLITSNLEVRALDDSVTNYQAILVGGLEGDIAQGQVQLRGVLNINKGCKGENTCSGIQGEADLIQVIDLWKAVASFQGDVGFKANVRDPDRLWSWKRCTGRDDNIKVSAQDERVLGLGDEGSHESTKCFILARKDREDRRLDNTRVTVFDYFDGTWGCIECSNCDAIVL
jgi:hypothetical protein